MWSETSPPEFPSMVVAPLRHPGLRSPQPNLALPKQLPTSALRHPRFRRSPLLQELPLPPKHEALATKPRVVTARLIASHSHRPLASLLLETFPPSFRAPPKQKMALSLDLLGEMAAFARPILELADAMPWAFEEV